MGEIQKNILVVDDDPKIRRLLRNCFEPEGFGVFEAENSREVEICLQDNRIDLITLDLNLGAENGLTIAASIKAKSQVPIIIVTGKGDVIDRVVGLEMGADDYISKPFHIREVIARVRSVLRRTEGAGQTSVTEPGQQERHRENRYSFNDWTVDLDTLELNSPCGNPCDLTTADFKLLKILLENPKRVLSREQIMDYVNGNEWTPQGYRMNVAESLRRTR